MAQSSKERTGQWQGRLRSKRIANILGEEKAIQGDMEPNKSVHHAGAHTHTHTRRKHRMTLFNNNKKCFESLIVFGQRSLFVKPNTPIWGSVIETKEDV